MRYVFQSHWLDATPRISRNTTPTATALQMSTVPVAEGVDEVSRDALSRKRGLASSRSPGRVEAPAPPVALILPTPRGVVVVVVRAVPGETHVEEASSHSP